MKKSTKYSAVIAAALLAVAPMAISNTVKADEKPAESHPAKTVTDIPVKAEPKGKNTNVVFNNNKDKVNQNAKPSLNKDQKPAFGDIFTKADVLRFGKSSNMKHDITWHEGLTVKDIRDYHRENTHPLIGNDLAEGGAMWKVIRNGKTISGAESEKLIPGDEIQITPYMDGYSHELKPNTWYTWEQKYSVSSIYKNMNPGAKELPASLDKDIIDEPVTVGNNHVPMHQIVAKTDAQGLLPHISSSNPNVPKWSLRFGQFITEIFHIVPANETNEPSVSQPAAPVDTPAQPTEAVQPSQASQATNAAQPSTPNEDADQATTTVETPAVKKPLMIKHNAFVYNKHGKLVKKHGVYSVLKKYEEVKPLKHAKIVKIKGKKFYQIGKNRFIKVANTTVKPEMKKISAKATVKGIKASHVRLYNANGKYIKKYVNGKKNLKFDAEKIVKGHLYYRIKGTNNWIRANKVRLHK